MNPLQQSYDEQRFSNEYQLVDGVAMHAENGARFQIPPDVIKRQLRAGQFVELRIDSPRFSAHENTEKCSCPSCNGELTKPILKHSHPASLVPLPAPQVPSRGWGEDFWVRITERSQHLFLGVVDNRLVETRLHGVSQNDRIVFHENHILAVHDIHRQELVSSMNAADLKELTQWLGELRRASEF